MSEAVLHEMAKASRKNYLDVLRLLAMLMVVFIHTPANGFAYNAEGEGIQFRLIVMGMLCVSSLVHVAVPLFLMISGALLLRRCESISTLFRRRVLRFVCVLLLFYILQYAYYVMEVGTPGVGIKVFLKDFYHGNVLDSYVLREVGAVVVWFFYAYLGVLLMLPFLRILVRNMDVQHFYYLIGVQFFCFLIAPSLFVCLVGDSPQNFPILKYLPLCGNIFIYILLGYFLDVKIDVDALTLKHWSVLVTSSLVCIIGAVAVTELGRLRMCSDVIGSNYSIMSNSQVLPAATIFLLVKRLFSGRILHAQLSKLLSSFGGAVFTVMLVENIARREISQLFEAYRQAYMPSIWVAVLSWICGLILGMILKKMPILRHIL